MKDLVTFFGLTLGIRNTQKQKEIFYKTISKVFNDMNYDVSLQSSNLKLLSLNNIVIGDLKKAKTVIATAYDTPTKAYLKGYKYYPFNTLKNIKQENKNLIIQLLISLVLIGVIAISLWNFNSYNMGLKVVSILVAVICIIYVYKIVKGKPNEINLNRNSSSVAMLTAIASELKKNNDVAFVLLDRSVTSFEGLKFLKGNMLDNKEIVILDCIAAGEKLVVAHRLKTKLKEDFFNQIQFIDKKYTEEEAENNVLNFFSKCIYITSGSIEGKQLVVKNTRSKKDFDIDISRLEKIKEGLIDYLRCKYE